MTAPTKAQFKQVTAEAYAKLEERDAAMRAAGQDGPMGAWATVGEITLQLQRVFTPKGRAIRDTYKLNGKKVKKEALLAMLVD